MGKTREIKKRMTAVRNIERITKTMQMIATAKFTSALHRAKATQPYAERIREMVADVAAAAGDIEHPFFNPPSPPTKRELLLVIVSDRGLCGAYNTNVLRQAYRHVKANEEKGIETRLEISGKKAVAYFRFAGMKVADRHSVFGDKPPYEEVARLAESYMEQFESGAFDAVRVAYTRFISNARQSAEIIPVLPLSTPASAGSDEGERETSVSGTSGNAAYEFSPGSEELLAELLPESVKMTLFQCFNDAVVSEQVMRMVAMKAATDNAKQIGRDLRREFNRARQAQITTELMEVIAGAAALE